MCDRRCEKWREFVDVPLEQKDMASDRTFRYGADRIVPDPVRAKRVIEEADAGAILGKS